MKIEKICILGGTGFIGGHLVSRLIKDGYKIRLLTRHRERNRHFLVMPEVELRQVAGLDADTLAVEFGDCQAVINLVGILNGSPEAFRRAHAELPARVVEACGQLGIQRYLHMSALNADAEHGPSEYLKSKGAGEAAAHAGAEHSIRVTSFRPSVVFGPDDSFFNRFATLLKLAPAMPLACPGARFAPVYVGDVVEAFVRALNDESTADQRYELCGPKVYTLRELVEYTARLIGRKRLIIGLNDKLSRLQGRVFEKLPGQPFTTDNYLSLQVDSVCSSDGLAALGIEPKSVESLMPRFFSGEGRESRYDDFRRISRR
jgi:uncharacterized protein YbjT (DUF2867 family)